MHVFVSWSKSASRSVAEVFADWLPRVIQECEPFISSDTEKGDVWFDTIERNLADARVGVLFLTPENQDSAWLNYEAGALRTLRSGNMQKLCAVFIGMRTADYDGPIKNFQMTNFTEKDDMLKLLKAINGAADRPLDAQRLQDEFEEKWDRLRIDTEAAVAAAAESASAIAQSPKKTRSSEEKLDEVLDLLREMRFARPLVTSGHKERAKRELELEERRQADETDGWLGQYLEFDGRMHGEIIEIERKGGRVTLLTDQGMTLVGTVDSLRSSIMPF